MDNCKDLYWRCRYNNCFNSIAWSRIKCKHCCDCRWWYWYCNVTYLPLAGSLWGCNIFPRESKPGLEYEICLQSMGFNQGAHSFCTRIFWLWYNISTIWQRKKQFSFVDIKEWDSAADFIHNEQCLGRARWSWCGCYQSISNYIWGEKQWKLM